MGVARFNALPRVEAERELLTCCAAPRWAASVAAARPYASASALVAAADLVGLDDLDSALAAHPRIGAPGSAQSRREQSGVDESHRAALAAANREYEARFGHIFLIRATGLSGDQMLAALRRRLANDTETERMVALAELRKITAPRLADLARRR